MATQHTGGSTKAAEPTAPPVDGGDNQNDYQKFLDFLSNPVWVLPVMTFLEQKSLVFDSETPKENSIYLEVHHEYRNLVDTLIQSFCDDAQISVRSLVDTLKSSHAAKHKAPPQRAASIALVDESVSWMPPADYVALEPVLAASDYDLFVHMMIKKNIDLQLQALQMIEVMCGALPDTMDSLKEFEKSAGNLNREDQERFILMQVIRQSLAEFESDRKNDEAENQALQKALQDSLREKKRLEIEKQHEESLIRAALKLSLDEKVTMKEFLTDSSLIADSNVSSESDKQQQSEEQAGGSKENDQQNSKDLQLRRQYLMQQRDKLLAMKRQARERALATMMENGQESVSRRPKTAKLARSSMMAASRRPGRNSIRNADGKGTTADSDQHQRPTEFSLPLPNHDVIAARRELMKKIKQEVIGL